MIRFLPTLVLKKKKSEREGGREGSCNRFRRSRSAIRSDLTVKEGVFDEEDGVFFYSFTAHQWTAALGKLCKT